MNVNRKNDSMKKILVWGLLAVLGIACYDDLGNYDYNDINDMVLEMPRSVSVTIPKKDSVLVEVKAAVTQLDRKDNANLTYLWKKNLSGVTWTECGTDSVCRIWVYPKNSGSCDRNKCLYTGRDGIANDSESGSYDIATAYAALGEKTKAVTLAVHLIAEAEAYINWAFSLKGNRIEMVRNDCIYKFWLWT